MRFLLATLAAITCLLPMYSQDANTDSLKNLLNEASGKRKSELLIEISMTYIIQNFDSALNYATKAFEYSTSINDSLQIAESYAVLGKIYLDNFQSEKSFQFLQKAEDFYKRPGQDEKLAGIKINIGRNYYNLNQYEKALDYYREAGEVAKRIENEDILANSLFYTARALNRLNQGEEALKVYMSALDKWEELGQEEESALVYNDLGNYYSARSDFQSAVNFYEKTLEIRRKGNNLRSTGITLNNLGNQYLQLGNFDKAINCYKEASEIFKKIGFDRGTAATLNGMGAIYENLRQYKPALEVYNEVVAIYTLNKDKYELANALSNIAVTYSKMLNDSLSILYGSNYQDTIYEKKIKTDIEYGKLSIDYNLRALAVRKEINHTRGISITLANLGHVYQSIGEFEEANFYFNEWLQLPNEFHDDDTKIPIYIGLGKLAMYQGDFNKAILYFNDAYRSAKAINKKIHIREAARNLSDLYEKVGNYKFALSYFKEFHDFYDSLNQENTRRQIHEMQVKYETEAREKENELLKKDQLINETKLNNSRKALTAAVIVVVIFILLIIQLIRQNNFRRKANEELAKKNELISGQAKEITDSIQYASRIQNAVLPPEELLKNILPEQFIIFRPRDIVSGDYYWITEKNNKIIVMVADCTGHGVPGAFMSMLGIAYLNEIVSKYEDLSTDRILNEMRRQVIQSLHQTGKEGESQDGMDVSVFIIDKDSLILQFSGANNPLFIFRENEMFEMKADKMPIGIHTKNQPFTAKDFQLKKGDMLYAFSDGYADQFGGTQGKKFMIKNFKKLLHHIHSKDIQEQKIILDRTLDEWMADFSQIDDILVMGVRI